MDVVAFSVLVFTIQLFSEKHYMWRMTPIPLCTSCGTHTKKMVLTAHFPFLAPTGSSLVQSESMLGPK